MLQTSPNATCLVSSNLYFGALVGAEVNINPLFTIIILVAGDLVWGIPGMVLAIPLLGIVKIICDHIELLKPYGFFLGQKKKKQKGLIVKPARKK